MVWNWKCLKNGNYVCMSLLIPVLVPSRKCTHVYACIWRYLNNALLHNFFIPSFLYHSTLVLSATKTFFFSCFCLDFNCNTGIILFASVIEHWPSCEVAKWYLLQKPDEAWRCSCHNHYYAWLCVCHSWYDSFVFLLYVPSEKW